MQTTHEATTFRQLVEAVAAHLDGFRLAPDDSTFSARDNIIHDDGRRLIFVPGEKYGHAKPGQMRVSGIYPRDKGNDDPYSGSYVDPREVGGEHNNINVSMSKTPEQIARDISRRLLPEYDATFGKMRDLIATRNARRADIAVVTEDLRRAMHASYSAVRVSADKQSATIHRYLETGSDGQRALRSGARIQVTVHSGDSVALDVTNLTPEAAAKILALLAG